MRTVSSTVTFSAIPTGHSVVINNLLGSFTCTISHPSNGAVPSASTGNNLCLHRILVDGRSRIIPGSSKSGAFLGFFRPRYIIIQRGYVRQPGNQAVWRNSFSLRRLFSNMSNRATLTVRENGTEKNLPQALTNQIRLVIITHNRVVNR